MNEFVNVVQAVLPVFIVIAAGLVLRRLGWLTEEADASLLRVTINVMIPCLVFDSILGNPAVARLGNVLLAPVVGFGTVALGAGLALLAAKGVPAETAATRRTFAFSVAVYNYGYVPIPLALSLFDKSTVAVLFVHNVGVELALWSFGLTLLAGADPRREWRRLLSPPLVAIVVALLVNAILGERLVPVAARQAAHLLGQCAIPLGMVLIGATMADHLHEFRQRRGGRTMTLACLLRLGLLPALFLGVAWVLPLSTELTRVVVLQAAMPAAVFPIVMARHYGGDAGTALRVVVATTAMSLITTPLWIQAGMKWLQP
jgi:predicted permease